FLAKRWDEANKGMEEIAKQMKDKIVKAIDDLIKKVESELMAAMEKVLAKALETAATSWDLKETESKTADAATQEAKALMKKVLEDAKEALKKLWEDFKGVAQEVGTKALMNLVMGTDAA